MYTVSVAYREKMNYTGMIFRPPMAAEMLPVHDRSLRMIYTEPNNEPVWFRITIPVNDEQT